MRAQDRIIVALDHENILEAEALTQALGDEINFYKIGLGSLTLGGGALAVELKNRGKRIFMDLKFFDIPATVERAVRGHAALGFDFLTVHGDPSVVEAAKLGARSTDTKILAVTILTSSDRSDLDRAQIKAGNISELVVERALRAFEAGADGVIASAQEAASIRAHSESAGKLIVTPGIRPKGSGAGDQKRVLTPEEAIMSGADYLVIGRPIIAAANPLLAAQDIISELQNIRVS